MEVCLVHLLVGALGTVGGREERLEQCAERLDEREVGQRRHVHRARRAQVVERALHIRGEEGLQRGGGLGVDVAGVGLAHVVDPRLDDGRPPNVAFVEVEHACA
eukprot:483707-Pleurochrysis_carterae.AAC.2